MNRVKSGKHAGKRVIVAGLGISITTGIIKPTLLSKQTIKSFEILNTDSSNSMAGALTRGVVGGAAFGVAGAVAGAVSSKSKYLVKIEWLDGETSIIETDGKGVTALNVAMC